jgi:Flp pilus assembly protein TadD
MAIKHNPTHSYAYNNRGACLHNLNRLDEALASYDMALKHNPNYVNAINNRKILLDGLL